MPTVVKKKRPIVAVKKLSEAKMRALAEGALREFQAASEERYNRAKPIYDAQDAETKDALDRMVDLLSRIARKNMWVSASRGSSQRMLMTLPDQVIRHNMFYMAVEILKDLAQMDVKVAGFQMPKTLCVVCSKPVKKKRK